MADTIAVDRDLLQALHELVIDLIMQSMDPDHTAAEQVQLHRAAKELRRRLVALRVMRFDAATAGYGESSQKLAEINEQLRATLIRINDMVKFMRDVSTLVASVDRIIQAAIPG